MIWLCFLTLFWGNPVSTETSGDSLTSKTFRMYQEPKKTWNDARKICEDDGGRLPVIDKVTKEALLAYSKHSDNVWMAIMKNEFWIGLNKEAGSNYRFRWDHCEPLKDNSSFTFWDPMEPQNVEVSHCVYAEKDTLTWRTSDCLNEKQFICEVDSGRPCTYTYTYVTETCTSAFHQSEYGETTRAACEDKCNTELYDDLACWMYTYTVNKMSCTLHFDGDPEICGTQSKKKGPISGRRTCFTYEVASVPLVDSQKESFPIINCTLYATEELDSMNTTDIPNSTLDGAVEPAPTTSFSTPASTKTTNTVAAETVKILATITPTTASNNIQKFVLGAENTINPTTTQIPSTAIVDVTHVAAKQTTTHSSLTPTQYMTPIPLLTPTPMALASTIWPTDFPDDTKISESSSAMDEVASVPLVDSQKESFPIINCTLYATEELDSMNTTDIPNSTLDGAVEPAPTTSLSTPASTKTTNTVAAETVKILATITPTTASNNIHKFVLGAENTINPTTTQIPSTAIVDVTHVAAKQTTTHSSLTPTQYMTPIPLLTPTPMALASTIWPTDFPDDTKISESSSAMAQTSEGPCPCWQCFQVKSATEIQKLVDALIRWIKVDQTKLSATRRKKASAPDDRPSAQAIGRSGIIFLVIFFSFFVMLDAIRVVKFAMESYSQTE